MKPSDYHLGSRDFFAIMVPGTLCVMGIFVGAHEHPFQLAATATAPQLVAAVLVSFGVGYVLQAIVQRVVHKWFDADRLAALTGAIPAVRSGQQHSLSTNELEAEARKIMLRVDPQSSRFTSLHHWCRRVIEERSNRLYLSLPDLEQQVQFLMAMPVALGVLSVGIWRSHDWRLAVLSAAGAVLFFFRFLEIRSYQRRSWLTKVLMLDSLGLLGSYGREPIAISPETLVNAFGGVTGVMVNWDRYLKERWQTSLEVLTTDTLRSRLDRTYFPWYLDDKEQWVDFEHARLHGARPIALSEIATALQKFPKARLDAIRRLADQFRGEQRPQSFPILAYAFGGNRTIVMDGNHRLAAALITQCPVSVLLFVMHGPEDSDALPDIQLHHKR